MTGLTAWSNFALQDRLYDLDTLTFYIPWYGFMGDRLGALDIPGWLPYQFSGTAFAADPQSGWMYFPAMVFFTFLTGSAAQIAFLVFHWLLAGLSMFALARFLGMRSMAAMVAAIAFEFGTFMEHTHMSLLRSQLSAWLPLALLGIELSFRSRSWTGRALAWSLTGAALSQVLAAWVGQGAYLALLVAGTYLAYRTVIVPDFSLKNWSARLVHLTVGGGVILAVTYGLNAAALLPRLEWNQRTNLSGGDYSDLYEVGGRGWSVARLVDRITSYENGLLYWYVGVAALTLAVMAFVVATRRYAVPYFAALTAVIIALALDDGPVHRIVYLLPQFERLHQHQPNRSLVVLSLTVPLLAAATIDRLREWSGRRLSLVLPFVPMGLYGLAAVALPSDLNAIGSSTRNALFATIALLAVTVLVGQRELRERWRWRVQPGTVFALLFAFLIWWDPTGSAVVKSIGNDAPQPVAQRLIEDYSATSDTGGAGGFLQDKASIEPPFRFYGIDEVHWINRNSRSAWSYSARFAEPAVVNILPGPRATRLKLEGIQGYNPVHIKRYDEFFEAMNGQGQNYHVSEVLQEGVSSPLIDLLNVRYIVVPSGRAGGWDGAELVDLGVADRIVYTDADVHILENGGALPRAWIVHEARTVEPGGALEPLTSGSVDPRLIALIETEPPSLAPPGAGARETVTVLPSESPDRMRLTATLNAAGLVVVSEVYDPGWHAYVDGERVSLLVTDHILRSVPVPAGTHEIELRFEPTSLVVGVVISSLTAIAIAGLAALVLWGHLVGRSRGLDPITLGGRRSSPRAASPARSGRRRDGP